MQAHTSLPSSSYNVNNSGPSSSGESSQQRNACGNSSNEHLRKKHAHDIDKSHVCKLCSKRFSSKQHLNVHCLYHASEKKCVYNNSKKLFIGKCNREYFVSRNEAFFKYGKRFSDLRSMNLYSRHTGVKSYRCEFCNRPFLKKSTLILHRFTHTVPFRYACNFCQERFRFKYLLNVHYEKHFDRNSSTNFDVNSKKSPEKHVTHSVKKPFACDVCNKQFVHEPNFIRHFHLHAGKKPFICNECSKNFLMKSDLEEHYKYHLQQRYFECNVCKKRYKQKSLLVKHMRRHKRERKCGVCNSATSKVILEVIYQNQTREKLHVCKMCYKTLEICRT